ncbi:hypothetical protein [Sphingomonas sp. AX6]|uniref:hypothetical protein n=1 Tax=Sphingomonas sp. AX6 TaxID=2653171 RepID=UPI0012EFE464|nr:hypothetical protein [Sphingomonas sp. AX6]VXC42387.1 conserved hypothetical protein [Sphingomonas sp. AX6]
MVAYTRQRLNLPIAGAAGGASALLAALAFALAPLSLIESLVVASGLPGLLGAAEPPLGATARALLCFGGSVGAGALVLLVVGRIVGNRTLSFGRRRGEGFEATPIVRRADSHPDAPPRPPVIATRELGAPMMSVGAEEERPLPQDLDTPLAEFDPLAFIESHPPQPLPNEGEPDYAVAAPAPLPRPAVFDVGERFDTFALNPPVATSTPRAPQPAFDREISVPALLERLEAGISRRATDDTIRVDQGDTRLSIAIDSLRRLAAAG